MKFAGVRVSRGRCLYAAPGTTPSPGGGDEAPCDSFTVGGEAGLGGRNEWDDLEGSA